MRPATIESIEDLAHLNFIGFVSLCLAEPMLP